MESLFIGNWHQPWITKHLSLVLLFYYWCIKTFSFLHLQSGCCDILDKCYAFVKSGLQYPRVVSGHREFPRKATAKRTLRKIAPNQRNIFSSPWFLQGWQIKSLNILYIFFQIFALSSLWVIVSATIIRTLAANQCFLMEKRPFEKNHISISY